MPGAPEYQAVLRAAWRAHKRRKPKGAPRVVSLFSGAGGSSLGYSMAGFREVLAVDHDQAAVATFKLNFPGVPVWDEAIGDLRVDQALKLAGLRPGELELLDGSPPCQGFTMNGKRKIEDPRNRLFEEYVRLLEGLKPKALVMENVSGLVRGKMRLVFVEILQAVERAGYRVGCWLLDSVYFHVPQIRQRLIWIGAREDLDVEPDYPRPESDPAPARQALEGVQVDEAERLFLLEEGKRHVAFKAWEQIPVGGTMSEVADGGFNARKFDPDRPAFTLREADGQVGMYGAMHWSEKRRFTIAEAKRLTSFPDAFRFAKAIGWPEAMRQIGNCVPPLFMRSIARHVKRTILGAAR